MFELTPFLTKLTKTLAALLLSVMLTACSDAIDLNNKDINTQRWYSQVQVDQGKEIFQQNCASCHGAQAQSTPNWRVANSNGLYPPPPLNGTAHTWHHPFSMLKETIENGTPRGMPGWKEKLNDEQITATIAWIESHWPDRIYQAWLSRNP